MTTKSSGPSSYSELITVLIGRFGSARVKLDGIMTAVNFYSQHVSTKPPSEALSELLAIDFSKPVVSRVIPSGTQLVTFARLYDSKPGLGSFYSLRGHSPRSMGINVDGRHQVLVTAESAIPALESTASGVRDSWTETHGLPKPYADGGALQLRIADGGKQKLKYDANTGIGARRH